MDAPPKACKHSEAHRTGIKMASEIPVPTRGHHLLMALRPRQRSPGEAWGFCVSIWSAGASPQLTNLLEMHPTFCTLRAGTLSLIPGEGRSEGRGGGEGTSGMYFSEEQFDSLTHLWATLFGEGWPSSSQGPGLAQLTEFAVTHVCKRCHLRDC